LYPGSKVRLQILLMSIVDINPTLSSLIGGKEFVVPGLIFMKVKKSVIRE